MPLSMKEGLGPDHIVSDENPGPLKKGHSPQYSAHVCCGQTAGWMKIPFGTDVGLGPGNIVLNGDSAPLEGGTAPPPLFGPCPLWRNGWMDQDAT